MSEEKTNGATEPGPSAPPQPDWDKFMAGIDRLNETVDGLRGELKPAEKEPEQKPEQKPEPLPKFDEMTQAELAQWFMQHTDKVGRTIVDEVAKALRPTQQQQQESQQAILEERYTREIETLMTAKGEDGKLLRPDFADWNEEMVAIVNEMPGITPLRAYNLAKSENPAKAKKLDEKYNPPPPKPKSPFSFAPGAGGVSAGEAAPKKHPDSAAAFRSAYAKVAARHPGVLPNLE